MTTDVDGLAAVCGRYKGEGAWVDEAAETRRYAIDLRIERLGDGRMRKWFKHVFFEEDTVTEQAVILELRPGGVLAVSMDGVPITGRGYFTGDALHYELDIPGNRVEVSLCFSDSGQVRVIGSSEKNSQGRYIWWQEQLVFAGQ